MKKIIKQDFLELNLDHKKGRCIIGNPPYGTKNNLTVAFYKKSIHIGDYISFILPISQFNNDIKLYEFDLIHTEDLGKQLFSGDRYVHCCLNIYRRPSEKLNSRPDYKLKDVIVKEAIKNSNPKRNKTIAKSEFNYDLRICAWGASIGKEVEYEGQYAKEFCFKVINNTYKNEILDLLRNADWKEIYKMTATPNLLQWQVYKYIKEQFPKLI